tara:strand:+ start:144 stop:284 length:141 start_codon:yes stop_codon:yes gene_type:complete
MRELNKHWVVSLHLSLVNVDRVGALTKNLNQIDILDFELFYFQDSS